ncbi:hypothetical protein Tco_0870768, partial [Tanacetum coccineum]
MARKACWNNGGKQMDDDYDPYDDDYDPYDDDLYDGYDMSDNLQAICDDLDIKRLVGNLCTVWIGRHRIHANAARFYRPKSSTSSHQPAMKGKIRDSSIGNTKDNGHRDDVS